MERRRDYISFLTIYLCKAHSIFVKISPNIAYSFPVFAKLKPKYNLLLKDTPTDQCKFETYEKFLYKITAFIIFFHNFWYKYSCDDSLSSDWWVAKCGNFSNDDKVALLTEPGY